MAKAKIYAHLALLLVALIYGLNYSLAKDVMPHYVQPRAFILIRAIGATFLFHLLGAFAGRDTIQRRHWPRLALCGLLGVAANQMFFFEGLNLTTPIQASVIMTVNPIVVMLLSALLLKTRIKAFRIVGIGLGLGGAVLLITQGQSLGSVFDQEASLGNLLVFCNASSYAAYLVVVKPLMAHYKAITVIKWVFTFGLLMVLPFAWQPIQAVQWQALPANIIGEIAFVVLGTTFLAYLLNIYALQIVSSTTVSIYIYLQPVFATMVAVLLGKDQLTLTAVLSAALIFMGVYLVSVYKRKVN